MVERVDDGRQPKRSQPAPAPAREPHRGQEHHAPALVSRDEGPIAKHQPPAFASSGFRHLGQQFTGPLVGEWQQGHFSVSVDGGDDPRRPTTEPSAAGIEQNRSRKLIYQQGGVALSRHHETEQRFAPASSASRSTIGASS